MTGTLLKNKITWICNLMFSCLGISEMFLDSKADSLAVCELPDSAIFEILLKLPAKSIVRCRYVCKSWYQLISEPYFSHVYSKNSPFTAFAITEHERYTKDGQTLDEHFFTYFEIGKNCDVIHRPLNLKTFTGITEAKKSSGSTIYDKSIVGSCNGLVCLVETPFVDSYFYLGDITRHTLVDPNQTVSMLNPLIGECTALPKFRAVYNKVHVAYGFGSTVEGEYYKVIRIAMKRTGCIVEAHILTIGVDETWRQFDIYKLPLSVYSHGVYMNGVLHFVGSNDSNLENNGIVFAFDIGNETGHCFALPCTIRYRQYVSRIFLAIWNGHLCVSDCSKEDLPFDLWTMKQYGVVESWRKEIIPRPLHSRKVRDHIIPITTMRNGDLFLSYMDRPYSFVQETKNLVEVKGFVSKKTCYFLTGCAYTPGFLSPRDIITREERLYSKGCQGTGNVV